ncbi:MAG: hypothetical protein CMD99_07160 [Gammaproteobacteria bacterium]|nr:hypothetical protein [Gammaproteobacteria bacterium]
MNLNQSIRDVARRIPPGKSLDFLARGFSYALFYKGHLRERGIEQHKMMIIATIARSGTHYAMLLLTNYVAALASRKLPIGPSEMNIMLPNNWHLNYMSYHKLPFGPMIASPPKPPNGDIAYLRLDEITRSHSLFQKVYWRHHKVLHLYRNPLDYSVSLYNYKHKKRPDLPDRCESPEEVLELKFENYCQMYESYTRASSDGRYSVLRIAYESLIFEPHFWLRSIVEWLGCEVDGPALEEAVAASTIKNVKQAENLGGKVNPEALGLRGSFISSGQVGQWREHYTDRQFLFWKDKFLARGIDIEAMILEG